MAKLLFIYITAVRIDYISVEINDTIIFSIWHVRRWAIFCKALAQLQIKFI